VQNALKQVPEKLNIQVQQSAQNFTISKSDQGRTLFKLQANKAVQFKQGGRVELHDVMITIYGTDGSRFDQIYGKNFEYDRPSGDVISKGEVSIDLQSNPQGAEHPDQATPRELKNPIHVKTTALVFNQKTGNAWTESRVEFYVPQLSGSAVGARYDANASTLTLESTVNMEVSGATPLKLVAQHAVLKKMPREIVLQNPHAESRKFEGQAEEATLFLRDDNTLDHALATGTVLLQSTDAQKRSQVMAERLELAMRLRNSLAMAVFSGDVTFQGPQHAHGSAGRAVLSFGEQNVLTKIHTERNVKAIQPQISSSKTAQDMELTAPVVDLFVADGNRLTRAETAGPPQIRLLSSGGQPGQETRVTAAKFTAKFDSLGQLSQVHGAPNARVVTTVPPQDNAAQLDRISTSDSIDAYFRSGTGVESLLQRGRFAYQSGTQRAFAEQARYTPADQILTLNGGPRIIDSGMETTARSVRLNRATGEGFATGNVKTSYSNLQTQTEGAMLASSDPVHVTADTMVARSAPASATYKGHVRLWQGSNLIEAPTIQFWKDQRTVIADSSSQRKDETALSSSDKNGKTTVVNITSDHLTYSDAERRAHYEGTVTARSGDMTVRSNQMDVFFAPRHLSVGPVQSSGNGPQTAPVGAGQTPGTPPAAAPGTAKLDKIVATGAVVITQPTRHATGDKLTYTASDDKFVVTGGPPSIFDAEHGKITGVSLTLFRTDDRVVVDGSSSSPAVTETRVVR
jgi:lipopolysaccharide export system protein LptA